MLKISTVHIVFILLSGLLRAEPGFAQKTFTEHFQEAKRSFADSDFANALSSFQNSIHAFHSGDDSLLLGQCYLRIGTIYGKLENYSAAQKYITQARAIFEKEKNDSLLIIAYNLSGNLASVNANTEEALNYYSAGLKLAEADNRLHEQGSIYNNIGSLYSGRQQYEPALHNFKKAYAIAGQVNSKYGLSVSCINIGACYRQLHDYKKALQFLNTGIGLARELNDLYQLQKGYEQCSAIYAESGDFEKAFTSINKANQYKDSVSSLEIKKKIIAQEAKFQAQQKELEILGLKTERQKDAIVALESTNKISRLRYSLGFIIGIAVLMVIASFLFFRLYKKKLALSLSLAQNKKELEQKNTDLNASLFLNEQLQDALRHDLENYKQLAYRKQMNPHFIFNSLNAVQNYVLTNDKLSANFYLGELSTLIRRILENSEKDLITLKEELFVCETYIKLEKKRFENEFEYTIACDKDINTEDIKIPPLILQPFIENAIWHGLLHKEADGLLAIDVHRHRNTDTIIRIRDNGVGRAAKIHATGPSGQKQESLGINLTRKRIAINNFLIDDHIAFVIHDLKDEQQKPCGTEVVLTINKRGT